MNIIKASLLKEGQKFTDDVFLEEDVVFLPANVALREKDLKFIGSLGVSELFTNGSLVNADEGPGAPSGKADLKGPHEPLKKVYNSQTSEKLENIIKQLDGIFTAIKNYRAVNIRSLWQITASLLLIIKDNRTDALSCFFGGSDGIINEYAMAKSSVNAAIITSVIGEDLGLSLERIQELAAGALLHDVGMLRLTPDVVGKQGALSNEDVQMITRHPIISQEIIKKELLYPQSVCKIALQHHERWDGTGYPRGLQGNSIDSGALIVSIADAFEAMICEKPYRNSMLGYEAMKTLVSENAAHFSPDMLKEFVRVMGIYPIGSGVQLNDGSIARVVAIHGDTPLRPVIQILQDKKGVEMKENINIDLLKNKESFIVRAIDIRSILQRF